MLAYRLTWESISWTSIAQISNDTAYLKEIVQWQKDMEEEASHWPPVTSYDLCLVY
jgi:hypothetical protein